MKIVSLETIPVSVPYSIRETSAIIDRGGVSDVVVRLETDTGLIGWGEACKATDTAMLERAIQSCSTFVIGQDPWERAAIMRDMWDKSLWFLQPMIGNSAISGIDLALWDLIGKDAGQPLYRLLGGALRPSVNYAHYLRWGDDLDRFARQAQEGVDAGYNVFYMKAGVDERLEERMLEVVRATIGPERRIRIDCNQGWTVPQAIRLINRWHPAFDLDFVEAPVASVPIDLMVDVRRAVPTALSANENLWRESDVVRMAQARVADYFCFSPHLVGTIDRFMYLAKLADLAGIQICKHTRGELGISASAAQHVMLAAPNACPGQQQNAARLGDDIVRERQPIRTGPDWGLIDGPGLGIDVDEEKLAIYHERYVAEVDYAPFGDIRRA